MHVKYSESTGGFYSEAIHGKNIPADAKPVTDERYAELLEGQYSGKIIAADGNGNPVLIDHPEETSAAQWATYQAKAKSALSDSDTSMLRIYEAVILGETSMQAADVVAFVKWRQALRAILSATQPEEIPSALPIMPGYPSGTGVTA